MSDKSLNLKAALGDQTRVTLGQSHKDDNQIVIDLTNHSDDPVAFGGFGKSGEFTVTVLVGTGTQDLVRTLEDAKDLRIKAPNGWEPLNGRSKANPAVRRFRLPKLPKKIFEPQGSQKIILSRFACCSDQGRARVQIEFKIPDCADFEATLEVEKKAATFELLFFEANPPYIATDADKKQFTLSWSTVQAGRVELRKNQDKLAEFTAGVDGFENGKTYTYPGEHPDLDGTIYELTAYDQASSNQSPAIRQTVSVLQRGWHAVEFRQYGYPAMVCNLDDERLYGIFIKQGHACLCSSKHPFASWDLEDDSVPDGMATSPAVSFNGRIWLVGGSSVDPGNCHQKVYSYHVNEGWQEHAANWIDRMGHACVAFNRQLWVIGGLKDNGSALKDVHSMDANGTWHDRGQAPWEPRCMMAAASYNRKLWIYGGCSQPFGDPRTDMWTLKKDSDVMVGQPPMPALEWAQYKFLPQPKSGVLGWPISNDLQVVNGKLHLLGSFRSGYTVQPRMCILNEEQRIWLVSNADNSWDQQDENTHSLSGATFNNLVFLRSLNHRVEDNPTKLYLYKP